MKKLHKSLASLLAIAMLLTSVPFAALAAEEADIVAEAPVTTSAEAAVTTVALQNEPGELPIVGVLDGIDIDWENYTAESTGSKFTRDYKLGLPDTYGDVPSTGTEDRFEFIKDSLPDEIPLFAPYTPAEIAASKTKFYVSPDGDDRNEGTFDKPFKTPYRAVKAVNELKSKRGGVTVYFRKGTYPLEKNIDLTNKTSGLDEKNLVFFSNYNNEKVVFTGSLAVEGKHFKPASDEKFKSKVSELARPHIVAADLKALGFTNFGTWTTSSRPSLYVEGAPYTIARWPNGANTSMAQYTGKDAQFGVKNKGYQSTNSELGAAGSGTGGFAFKYSNPRPARWEDTGNIWMYGYWYAEWTKEHQLVTKFDLNEQIVYTSDGLSYGGKYVKGNTYYYYNIFEELDQPGEWYLDDKTGMLYIYPVSEIKDDTLVQVVTTEFNLIRANACKYTVVNGINFDMGQRAFYTINDASYNIVQRCHIKNMSGYAVTFESGRFNGVTSCLIEAPNSIQIYGMGGNSMPASKDFTRSGNFAQNNYCKRIQSAARGNVMSHNLLNGSQGMGLYLNGGGGETICEYNEVVASPDEQLDAGCVYVNGGATNYGQVIRYNYLNKQTPKMRSAPYCMYLDDISSGMYVYGNILREGRTFLHGGQYNTIANNLTFDAGETFNTLTNSDNYKLTATRWDGWVLTGTRYTSGNPGHYNKFWMDRFPYIYEWHSRLIEHRYDFYGPNYDIANDPYGTQTGAPQDNVYIDNVFINANYNLNNATREIERVERNNHVFKIADIEKFGFEDYERGIMNPDPEAWAELCPDIAMPKPNHMFGIVYDPATIPTPLELGPINPQSPANNTETAILPDGVVLSWNEVYGKSSYLVKLAKDPEFKDIVLEQEQQGETVALPILDHDTTYYWTVTTTMWTNKFDQKPVTMPTATFRTMTLEDAEAFTELDTSTLTAYINERSKFLDSGTIIEEGSEAAANYPKDMPLYKAGTIDSLRAIVDDAKAKLDAGFKKQKEVEETCDKLGKKFWNLLESNAIPYTINMGTGSHTFTEDKYRPVANNLNPQYNGDTLVMDGNGSSMNGATYFAVNSAATITMNVKFDKLSQWTGIAFRTSVPVTSGFTGISGYGMVFKPDILELQRYPKGSNAIIAVVENNEEIVRSGVPFDLEATVKNVDDGIHVVIKINGETIVDHVDKEAAEEIYAPGYFGFMHNSGNTRTTIGPATGEFASGDDGFFSTIGLEKAITEATKFEAGVTEGEPGEVANYKVGTKDKLKAAIAAAKAAVETAASKEDVDAAIKALNDVVTDVKMNDANECVHTIRTLDLSQWKLTSPLAAATIEENGGIIAIVPDEAESTSYEFKTPLTSKQMMRMTLKYDTTGNWDAISTRKVASGLTPTQSRGYFFVIKDDLIEFQKYTAKSKGKILVTVENNNQIFKPGVTHDITVGSVNVEGGVMNKLIVDGETIIEYLDTEDPIYDQGYFSLFCHSKLGRKAIGPIAD